MITETYSNMWEWFLHGGMALGMWVGIMIGVIMALSAVCVLMNK